jgi:hypothetical protein
MKEQLNSVHQADPFGSVHAFMVHLNVLVAACTTVVELGFLRIPDQEATP